VEKIPAFVLFKKLSIENNRPTGENLPNLVTLVENQHTYPSN
jgi:hypothetical protein